MIRNLTLNAYLVDVVGSAPSVSSDTRRTVAIRHRRYHPVKSGYGKVAAFEWIVRDS
jgi:hypothetical protein